MPAISRAVATLRFKADDLEPDEITDALGVQPDAAQRKEDVIPTNGPSGFRVAKFGMWRMDAITFEPSNLDKQIMNLLNRLTQDIDVWIKLSTKYKADIFCGWFMNETNEGEDISSSTLVELGKRRLSLSLNIYAPETDA
jgi:hypothetical protein